MSDPYIDPETGVLRNRLGFADEAALRRYEYARTSVRLRQGVPAGDFDYTHLKAIHHHLFQDVYDWAGQERTVELTKGETLFCASEYIADQLRFLSEDLAAEHQLVGLSRDDFAERAAHFLCDLNAIHPFREGNGRTQRAFFEQLAAQAGYDLRFSRVPPEAVIEASIRGMVDEAPMVDLLRQALTPERERHSTPPGRSMTPEQQRVRSTALERLEAAGERRKGRERDGHDR